MLRQLSWVVFAISVMANTLAQAVTFNHVVSLGDSLLDDPLNRRSPLVSEHLAERLDTPLTELARIASTSRGLIQQGQHTEAASQFGAGDLATLWIGGNDFFLSTVNPFGVGIGNLAFVNRLEDNVDTILGTLREAGMEVLVFNLPDMSAVPFTDTITLFNFQLDNIAEATLEWNDRLAGLATEHDTHLVDVYSYFEEMSAHPEAFEILGNELVFGPEFGCQFCVFADPIHPSPLAQGLITNLAIDVLNEAFAGPGNVPLERLSETELAMLAGFEFEDLDTTAVSIQLASWQAAYGVSNRGDADGDNDSNGRDFLAWQRQSTGPSPLAASTTVPEPSTWMLLSLAVIWKKLAGRRRITWQVSGTH